MKKYTVILIVLLATGCIKKNDKMLIIGHRGAMGHETENSLASIQKAMDLGVDMIEIDVFKIKSNEIVVFHDERVERLTNGGGAIEEYNIYDLRQLTLHGNHKIPMLQDVLKLIDHKVPLNIELKGADTSDRVNFIINYYIREKGWDLEDFLISSFNWEELRNMRALNPDIAIAVLTEGNPADAIQVAKELGAMAINPNYRTLNASNVKEIKDNGFKVFTWTVNEEKDIAHMQELGVDGIFTNYPERAH